MFAAHFALGAGVKGLQPQVPLGALMVASQFLDVVFVPLYLTGIETIVPVGSGGYGGGVIHADYTHSLVGALALSLLVLGFGRWRWGARAGWVLGAVTFSHWVLDLVVHRADLALLPGNFGGWPTLGLSLWQYPLLAAGIELGLILVGTLLYGRSLLAQGTRGRGASWLVTGLMGTLLVAALGVDWLGIGG